MIEIARITIKDENLRNLKAVQEIIHLEEGQKSSLDEVLERILAFYRRFVQYN